MTNDQLHLQHLEFARMYATQKAKEAEHVRRLNAGSDPLAIERAVDRDPQVNAFQVMHDRAVQQAIMYGVARLVELATHIEIDRYHRVP